MPVPFRDAQLIDDLGTAAFLRFEREPAGVGLRGAIFVINARGEPIQFTFTRASADYSVLWRRLDIERHAARKLAESLFTACPQAPRILLCSDAEVPRELFEEDLTLSIPVCFVSTAARTDAEHPGEHRATSMNEALAIAWLPARPPPNSMEMRLLTELERRFLIRDGFDRASRGLREVYAEANAT